MIYFVYASSAIRLMTDAELWELLRQSRESNLRENITGLLLYQGGNVMQAIEGPEEAVIRLKRKIFADPRHHQITALIEEAAEVRQFPNWSMGFRNLDGMTPSDLDAYSPFLNDSSARDSFGRNPGKAHKLLLSFRRNVRS